MVREAGALFTVEDEKQIAAIRAQVKRADEQLCENAYNRVSSLLPAHFASQIDRAIARGEQPPPVPSWNERLAQTQHVRRALHARKKELQAQAFAILKPGILKFVAAAWKAAKAQDRDERGGLLERWRLTFAPSPMLRALAYLALRSSDPLLWFEDSGMSAMSTDPAQIWAHVIESQTAKPTGFTMAETREMQRSQEDARRAREMAAERDEHKRKLAEINRFNDQIRQQKAAAQPTSAGYSVPVKPAQAPEAPAPEAKP